MVLATIVSAFLTNINKTRSINDYIEHGLKLIKIRTPKIIFIEKEIYDTDQIIKDDEYTHFIPIEISDLTFYKYKEYITNFNLRKYNTTKDTIEYMMVQCNKTEWIRQAIEKNVFNTDQFVWIDFGIYHMISDFDIFEKNIKELVKKQYNNLRICNMWDINSEYWYGDYKVDIYLDVCWYFGGSVFGGDKKSLLEFANLTYDKVISIINEKKHIMWEINIWYLIYLESKKSEIYSELFNMYKCVHDNSILFEY